MGPRGERGERGEPGESITGPTGPQGERGEQGPQGETGATGEQGPKGDKGDTGAQGTQGERGPQGETGAKGADGQPGERGADVAPGIDGQPGQPGRDGANGITPELSIGKVSTVDSGIPAQVTLDGTADKPVLNFRIPRGMRGLQGEQGWAGGGGGGSSVTYENQLTTVGATNLQSLFTIKNAIYYGGRTNQGVVNIISITGSVKHTSPVKFYLVKNATLAGTPNFSAYATTSMTLYDSAATIATYTDNSQLMWSISLGDTGDFAINFDQITEELTLQPGESFTLCARSSTGSPSYVVGSINTREDQ